MSFPYRVGAPVGVRVGTRPAPGVTAEAAGPVWSGGGYWTSDGTGYWTGPTVDASRPYTVLVRFSRASAVNGHSMVQCLVDTTHNNYLYGSAGGLVFQCMNSSGFPRTVYASGGSTGSRCGWAAWPPSGHHECAVDADAVDSASLTAYPAGADAALYIGGTSTGAASAGLNVWDVTIYNRELTLAERTNIYALGVQTDPLTVAADAFACWDFANAYDNGGILTVPDLVLGDGTRDLIGTSVDLATDITTGATF